jgi:hypothetical protein
MEAPNEEIHLEDIITESFCNKTCDEHLVYDERLYLLEW